MFTPKWKKEAQHLVKGAKKFVDYKRDLLKPERIAEIDSRRADLAAAIKSKDLADVNEASKQLRAICENSLPHEKPLGWFEENVEVMFVAIVIALGLRAYYLQPFRIPTGSMQPTLNGIIGTPLAKNEWPGLPVRLWEKVMRGRSYVSVVNDKDRHVAILPPGRPDIRDTQMLHFFSRSVLISRDAEPLKLPAPASACLSAGLKSAIMQNGGFLEKGIKLCEGFVDTGDLVLVDKFSYHFRKPKRGEVFVFDTIDIDGIQKRSGPQGAGSHYIKRLCGVPGDTLAVQSPNLIVNGKIAQEPGIQRVIRGEGAYSINSGGYGFASPEDPDANGKRLRQFISKSGDNLTLAATARPGMREYAALGDNTGNSLDSRYWGSVKEFNLVGPALFSLWPFTTGHWGFIR
ncbi:signal peptidase I [Luteolibacter yonseiensis]|uniref:Signal peptidase I n=1 Tax=Luteolibacter yonseiensis TaxID=1144680 RepID=A0A934R6G3_9BACT|nr:signal peptidase I [Luteolibacter yonseiensis]MBK1816115.1 signal peptidase I [Luteolibacter yonseiensis]